MSTIGINQVVQILRAHLATDETSVLKFFTKSLKTYIFYIVFNQILKNY